MRVCNCPHCECYIMVNSKGLRASQRVGVCNEAHKTNAGNHQQLEEHRANRLIAAANNRITRFTRLQWTFAKSSNRFNGDRTKAALSTRSLPLHTLTHKLWLCVGNKCHLVSSF
ncbi:unnamed protein product [Ceratitis capitata]|uniref:(Mediterranean fruit fly) hypothetical protein n=1 Tax=Ceratitis capitata TaxID=7213 RepID=A0A811UFW7_CERCA|nr:unnamed protein product [Ceratitis capitata]